MRIEGGVLRITSFSFVFMIRAMLSSSNLILGIWYLFLWMKLFICFSSPKQVLLFDPSLPLLQ